MKLSADQIRSVCMGASRVEETENGVRFLRFTKEQEELYKVTNADFYDHNHRPCAGGFLCTKSGLKSLDFRPLRVNMQLFPLVAAVCILNNFV